LVPGLAGLPQDRPAGPSAGELGQLDVQALLADRAAEAFFGLAHPALNGVLVQCEPFGGGLKTPLSFRKTWRVSRSLEL
jgi:hypothetical protein